MSEDANTRRLAASLGSIQGPGKDGAFLGHIFSRLETVMCPLLFSSTNLSSPTTSHTSAEANRDGGGECVEGGCSVLMPLYRIFRFNINT